MLSGNDYKKLCKQLNTFGFSSYKDFLESDLWREFRKVLRKKHPYNRCDSCLEEADQLFLHHRTYKRLLSPEFVIWVCKDCHQQIHREISKSVDEMTVELRTKKLGKKGRLASMRIVPSSQLPETLHHSINASGIVNKVKDGESPAECLEFYYKRKLRAKDYLMVKLLEENRSKALRYLELFKN